jgi:SpoIID/LytB domain protein
MTGPVKYLEPLERGESGRICKLRIVGELKTFTVGKELEIRRILSKTHLKSSAFDVEYTSEGKIVLHGRGWGHGVGLCQIGAAVMATRGYDYRQILTHYYPGSDIVQQTTQNN